MQAAVENAGNDTAAWLREEYLDFKYELSGIKQDLEVKRDEIQNVVSRLQDRQMLQDNRNYLRAGLLAHFIALIIAYSCSYSSNWTWNGPSWSFSPFVAKQTEELDVEDLLKDLKEPQVFVYSYREYCAENGSSDYCSSYTIMIQIMLVVQGIVATFGFLGSFMLVFQLKWPSFKVEGGFVLSLAFPIWCAFIETVFTLTCILIWLIVVHASVGGIVGGGLILNLFRLIVSTVIYFYWRVALRYQYDRGSGKLYDEFIHSAKQNDINAILTAIVTSVDVNAVGSDGKTALHWTSKLNNTSASHILLQRGANVQLRDKEGWTALHWACQQGHVDSVRLLVKHKANVNAKGPHGCTPLMLSTIARNKDISNILIASGANPDAQNVYGQSALMLCALEAYDSRNIAVALTNLGASLHLEDKFGQNALHYAAMSGDKYMVETILHVSDSEFYKRTNKFGETPYELALMSNINAVLGVLLEWEHGDDVESVPDVDSVEDSSSSSEFSDDSSNDSKSS